MRCHRCQNALSARLDGEDPGVDQEAVERHVARCATCREYAARVETMHRTVRIAPAAHLDDLTPGILAAIGADSRRTTAAAAAATRRPWLDPLRAGLALLALMKLLFSLPLLVNGSLAGAGIHVAHESGSFDVALAIGLLVVAWQPWRAWGLLPVMATLTACLLTTSLVDVLAGHERVASEVHHSSEILGLGLVWLVGRAARAPRAGARSRARSLGVA